MRSSVHARLVGARLVGARLVHARLVRARATTRTLALTLALAACSESTAPSAKHFDSARVSAGVAAVQQAAASPAVRSLQQLARFGGANALTSSSLGAGNWSPGLTSAVGRLSQTANDAGTYLIPIIRGTTLGIVYTYDPSTRRYVPTKRGGAPSNGVRFILYKEGADSTPILDQEIGYADLTDEGRASATSASVKLVVVLDGVTRLSYAFTVALPGGSPRIDVTGYLVDGDERLNFTLDATSEALGSGPATVHATLDAPKEAFTVKATVVATPGSDDNSSISLDIASMTDRVVVESVVADGILDASVTVNGTLLAHATGDPAAPDIRGANGASLSNGEIEALKSVIEMAGDILQLISDLLKPVGLLLLLALGIGA